MDWITYSTFWWHSIQRETFFSIASSHKGTGELSLTFFALVTKTNWDTSSLLIPLRSNHKATTTNKRLEQVVQGLEPRTGLPMTVMVWTLTISKSLEATRGQLLLPLLELLPHFHTNLSSKNNVLTIPFTPLISLSPLMTLILCQSRQQLGEKKEMIFLVTFSMEASEGSRKRWWEIVSECYRWKEKDGRRRMEREIWKEKYGRRNMEGWSCKILQKCLCSNSSLRIHMLMEKIDLEGRIKRGFRREGIRKRSCLERSSGWWW